VSTARPTANSLRDELRDALEARHGPLMGGDALWKALGFASAAAFRQAKRRGHVTVPLFTLPKQRGLFALTREIADWLGDVRARAQVMEDTDPTNSIRPP
jgi:hypothetical protein